MALVNTQLRERMSPWFGVFLAGALAGGKGRMLVPAVLSAIGLSSMVKPSLELRRADQLA
jgi:hypothetical protein